MRDVVHMYTALVVVKMYLSTRYSGRTATTADAIAGEYSEENNVRASVERCRELLQV